MIEKSRNDKGLFEYNYLIYEVPHKLEIEKKHNHPDMETPTQINTNKQNTKKQIDKIDKGATAPFFDAEKHNRLTKELINSKYIDTNDSQITSYDAYRALLLSINQGVEIQNDENEVVSLDVDRNEEVRCELRDDCRRWTVSLLSGLPNL